MTIEPGARLGHYEIVEAIGAGGMGDVYRARDTKLHREVAIKLLSEKLAPAPERLARFEREAHLLASIIHPNIATIHGLEKDRGVDFLVLEFVEGETLAERIARGPIPLERAISLFEQIAHGLEAAHDKGIIHRDLKPANVMITPEGQVKILDFGLGKVFEETKGAQADLSQSPTLTREGTRTGVILGTAAYMSPEQARGDPVDKRTDIWAFGCCLYEALTGKPPFRGATVTDILAAVMRAEPDWESLPKPMPASVRRLLLRCLSKEKSDRLHHIADARLEVNEGLLESDPSATNVAGARGNDRARWIWVSVGVSVFAWGLWNFMSAGAPASSGRPVRLTLSVPEPISLASPARVAVSPQGDEVVFVGSEGGDSRLYARDVSDWNVEPLPGTEDAVDVFFSPDGEWVGFSTRYRSLKKVALNGGAPLVLCADCVSGFYTGGWGADGTLVFTPSSDYGLARISADHGGTPESLVQPDESQQGTAWYVGPQVLPGGKVVLSTYLSARTTRIDALTVDTGELRTIVEPGRSARYLPTGHLVYTVDNQLLAVPFSVETLEVKGAPTPVLGGVEVGFQSGASYDVSQNGTLVYTAKTRATLVWSDGAGVLVLTPAPARDYKHPAISPDGRFAAVSLEEVSSRDIWVSDLQRGTLTRLTFGGDDVFSLWTPDGKYVVYTSGSAGGYNLYWTPGDGSGSTEALTTGKRWHKPTSWSPDGSTLLVNVSEGNSRHFDVYELRMDQDRALVPLLNDQYSNVAAVFSPDGNWIAHESDESGRTEVYVRSYPDLEQRQQVSVNGGSNAIWHPSGNELMFAAGNRMMVASILNEPALRVGVPKLLFEMDQYAGYAGLTGRNYDLSPDGERFLFVKSEPSKELHVVVNWFEELNRLVPVDN